MSRQGMSPDHPADTALRALGELRIPEPLPQAEAKRRRRVIERLEQAPVVSVPRRGQLALGVLAALALGVAALLVVSLWPAAVSAPSTALGTANVEQAIASGSEVKTEPGSSAQLRTALGAQIKVAGSSALRLAGGPAPGQVERVELSRGVIQVKVPKLGPQRQFQVSTPDTLVIVHGTEFSVAVREQGGGRTDTLVEVTSGRVEVRRKQAVAFLGAGAAWSSDQSAAPRKAGAQASKDPSAPASGKVSAATPVTSIRAPASARSGVAPREQSKSAKRESAEKTNSAARGEGSLARANALLSSALEASRRGDDEQALVRLDALLRRYPDSPVADNARVERFRTLRRLGRQHDAARAAAGYLKGSPDGFARDEARALEK